MSIAIMACRKVCGICAASGCFKSYNNSTEAFEIYKDKKEDLASFFYCIGCKETAEIEEDWSHKINQLKKNKVEIIHIAKCVEVECHNYDKHEKILEKEGFKVVHGTHA